MSWTQVLSTMYSLADQENQTREGCKVKQVEGRKGLGEVESVVVGKERKVSGEYAKMRQ